jgi:hypothetical protein
MAVLVSGCASGLMREAPNQQVSQPGPKTAKVVFMRSSMVAAAIGCDLFEVVGGDLKFIGQLPTGNKVVYETTPGKKVFMAYGTAADYMLAELAPGKTYYAIVRPNWGTGGFAPTPIRDLKSAEAKEWISGTKLLEVGDQKEVDAWLAENKQRLQGIHAEYWSRFERKSDTEKAERTMLPIDGQ